MALRAITPAGTGSSATSSPQVVELVAAFSRCTLRRWKSDSGYDSGRLSSSSASSPLFTSLECLQLSPSPAPSLSEKPITIVDFTEEIKELLASLKKLESTPASLQNIEDILKISADLVEKIKVDRVGRSSEILDVIRSDEEFLDVTTLSKGLQCLIDTFTRLQQTLEISKKDHHCIPKEVIQFNLQILTHSLVEKEQLGKGKFGEVSRVTSSTSTYAAKTFSDGIPLEHIVREHKYLILSDLHPHEHIINMLGLYSLKSKEFPSIISPLYNGGTLQNAMDNNSLSWLDAFKIIREISSAVTHLHSLGIQYKDLKPENIMLEYYLDEKGNPTTTLKKAILIDLGLAGPLHELNSGGTVAYTPPESIYISKKTGRVPFASCGKGDVWSFGMLLYQMATGGSVLLFDLQKRPKYGKDFSSLFNQAWIVSKIHKNIPGEGSSEPVLELKNLIIKCLQVDPNKRPSMKEVHEELERIRTKLFL